MYSAIEYVHCTSLQFSDLVNMSQDFQALTNDLQDSTMRTLNHLSLVLRTVGTQHHSIY